MIPREAIKSYIPVEDLTNAAFLRYRRAMSFVNSAGLMPFSRESLSTVADSFAHDLTEGITKNPSSLKMIPTLLQPVEKEKLSPGDEALVIEIGGTNVRGSVVIIGEDGEGKIKKRDDENVYYQEAEIPQRSFNNPDEFFDTVLKCIGIEKLLEGNKPKALAIVYSFPGEAIKTEHGTDIMSPEKLTKGFSIPGISSKPVGEAFLNKLHTSYGVRIDMPLVVLNDTSAVLSDAKIGGVVASGKNFALSVEGEVYNTESGGFNKIPRSSFARWIDEKSILPGEQLAEKQISGIYLEQQLNHIVDVLVKDNCITHRLAQQFKTDFISDILGLDKKTVEQKMHGYTDTYSYAILTAVAGRLRHLSAQIVGAMIGGTIRAFPEQFPRDKKIRIPIEGSVFWKIPGYKELVAQYALEIVGSGFEIEFVQKEHAGIIGAGVFGIDTYRRKQELQNK